jgi:hypothetical protein
MSTISATNRFQRSIFLVLAFVFIIAMTLIWLGGGIGGSAPTTVTTIQDASNTPSGVTFIKPFTTVPQNSPAQMVVPVVPMSATTCTSSLVSAGVTGVGPNTNNPSTGQLIIGINSSVGCSLLGFPSVTLSDSAGPVATQVTNGGTVGASLVPSTVTLGTSVPGSFMIQYNQNLQCPVDTSVSMEIPGSSVPINVNLNATLVEICGSINITPIIQGDNALEYWPDPEN